MGIVSLLCLGLLAFEGDGAPVAPSSEPMTTETAPVPAPPPILRSFVEVQGDWLWPRVTPRFLHDMPRGSIMLEPTFAPQVTVSLLRPSGVDGEKSPYLWLSGRLLTSEGSAWRVLPTDGLGFVQTKMTVAFTDCYLEDVGNKEWDADESSWRTLWYGRLGLRLAYFGIDSDWQSNFMPRRTDENYLGLGPFLGWHNTRFIGSGQFQFFDDWEISSLFGGVRHHDEETIPSGTVPPFSGTGLRSRFILGLRARAGFHWYEEYGNVRLRLSVGYQGEYFSHIGDEIDSMTVRFKDGQPITVETEKKSVTDLLSHGPFVQCEIRY